MPRHWRDVDRLQRHAQPRAEPFGIPLRARRRAESRQREGVDARAVQPQPVERLHADEERERAVESAREADHDVPAPDRLQARREPRGLDGQDLLAARVPVGLRIRHERMRFDGAPQGPLRSVHAPPGVHPDPPDLPHGAGGAAEREIGGALEVEEADVHVRHRQLRRAHEAPPLREQRAVLGDEGMSAEDEVRRRLAHPGPRVDVGREAAGGLPEDERTAVFGFSHEFVRPAQVQDHVGPAQGEPRRGRVRRPHVLAQLHADDRAVPPVEDEVVPERHVHARQLDFIRRRLQCAREPARFVELVGAGQIGLGHDAHEAAARDHGGAVEDASAHAHGEAHGDESVTAVWDQLCERPLGGVEEVGLVEEVRARVARQAQFGEDGHLHARRRNLPQKRAAPMSAGRTAGTAAATRRYSFRSVFTDAPKVSGRAANSPLSSYVFEKNWKEA